MFKRKLSDKKVIAKAETFYSLFKNSLYTIHNHYPILDESDKNDQSALEDKINEFINALKSCTENYLDKNLSLIDFNNSLSTINKSYNNLRETDPIFNSLVIAYLSATIGGGANMPRLSTVDMKFDINEFDILKRNKNN